MDDREQQRKIKHRMAVLRHAEEITGNVALTCRYFGISRPTFYKWRQRYEEHGPEGLLSPPAENWTPGTGRTLNIFATG